MADETKACPNCGRTLSARVTECRFCAYDFATGRVEAPPPPVRTSGTPLVALAGIVVVGVAIVVAAAAFLMVRTSHSFSGERNASASLKTLSSAEADFRSNDRDGDGKANYWVRDVYSLYALCPCTDGKAATAPTPAAMIKLIEPSVAWADASNRPVLPGAVDLAGCVGTMCPKSGYVYRPFERCETGGTVTPIGSSGPVAALGDSFDDARFAFMTVPTSLAMGRNAFAIGEDGTIYRISLSGTYAAVYIKGVDRASISWSGAPIAAGDPWPSTPPASWQKLD